MILVETSVGLACILGRLQDVQLLKHWRAIPNINLLINQSTGYFRPRFSLFPRKALLICDFGVYAGFKGQSSLSPSSEEHWHSVPLER